MVEHSEVRTVQKVVLVKEEVESKKELPAHVEGKLKEVSPMVPPEFEQVIVLVPLPIQN